MKAMKKVLALGMALAMVVTAVPVTSAEAATTAPKLSTTSVTVAASSVKTQTKTIKVTTPSNWKNVKVSAKSSNTSKVKTSVSGKTVTVRGKKKGTATVTVTVKGTKSSKAVSKKLTAKVKVINASVSAASSAVSVEAGEVIAAPSIKTVPSSATVKLASSDTSIVKVNSKTLKIRGVAEGTATVTVKTNYGKTATIDVTVTPAVAVVASAVATNATTIALTGKNLDLLTINNIKINGYTAQTVTPSEDGKTATIVLGSALVPDQEVVLTVTIDGVATDYTVKYSVNATAVAVKDATYKTSGSQKLTVLVNGVETSVDELETNGYEVTFYAYQEDNLAELKLNTTLLDGASSSNKTGKLAATLTVGTYKVKAVLVKGSTTLTSEYATIKVTDKQAYETGISSAILTVTNKAVYTVDGTSVAAQQGDVLGLTDLKVSTSYGDNASVATGDLSKVIMTSDNTQVATVDQTNLEITAHKPGTAKITFTYGTLTKEVTLTVKTDGRSFSTVTIPSWVATTVLQDSQVTVPVAAIDNYGANMIGQYIYVELGDNNSAVDGGQYDLVATGSWPTFTAPTNTAAVSVQTGADGFAYLQFAASNNASAKATFRFFKGKASNGKEGSLLRTFNVTTASKQSKNYKLELVKANGNSSDTTIDYNPINFDNKIVLELNKYYGSLKDSTVADMKQDTTAKNWIISYDDSIISVADDAGNAIGKDTALSSATGDVSKLTIAPTSKAGTTTITLKNDTQGIEASFAVTTKNTVPSVKDIKLSAASISTDVETSVDYRNLFSIVTNKDNPELQGVTLENNSMNYTKVKLFTTGTDKAYKYTTTTKTWGEVAMTAGDIYIESASGNLCIGTLAMRLTVNDSTGYVPVTTALTIPANAANSLIFAVVDDQNKVINTLVSGISINSYK